MLFDLWVLCLITTALGMFLVSVVSDGVGYVRRRLQEGQADFDASGTPLGC
jgi:hypothetical protein